ncbi:hypothetical protein ID10_09840 [Pantoea agglomerans]|uniref:nuclear transport factor 2 family protein n=1 Tax=Enterobacter agglomerans TaxID=549 RepID=UPI00050FA10C|nr:nuclear transport factor 2 family protein [Pantoea agglomerans]KGD76890.1 hypothetical protein ID10_09840 [Pantoea agglomerans]
MLNIIIPMSGASLYETSADFIYPKILTEINNRTLLEYSQDIFATLTEEHKSLFIVPADKLTKLALGNIIELISPSAVIIPLQGMTKGAVCSSMMAIDEIDLDEELIISSADHYINDDLQQVLDYFRSLEADAGVLTFESVHPKWSFAKANDEGFVVQTAEKNAISRNAIAGLYYFKKGSDFIEAAKELIRKDNSIDNNFYLSSSLNEMVLKGKKIVMRPLADSVYHNFYDAHAVKAFEMSHVNPLPPVKKLTEKYIAAFNAKSLHDVVDMFDRNATLIDPVNHKIGQENIRSMLVQLFSETKLLEFKALSVLAEQNRSVIEFELKLDDKLLKGVDIIDWNNKGHIVKLNAYLY